MNESQIKLELLKLSTQITIATLGSTGSVYHDDVALMFEKVNESVFKSFNESQFTPKNQNAKKEMFVPD